MDHARTVVVIKKICCILNTYLERCSCCPVAQLNFTLGLCCMCSVCLMDLLTGPSGYSNVLFLHKLLWYMLIH